MSDKDRLELTWTYKGKSAGFYIIDKLVRDEKAFLRILKSFGEELSKHIKKLNEDK